MTTRKQPSKWLLYEPVKTTVTRIIPELAVEIGLNESVMLLQISFWISTCNNVNEGKYWTYQSLRDMQEKAFPYWSVETIRRTIQSLQNKGYILVGNFNERKGDKTQWFALEPDKCSSLKAVICTSTETETPVSKRDTLSENETGKSQNVTTLPETTTEIRKEIPSSPKAKGGRAANPEYDLISELWQTTASGIIVNIQGLLFGTKRVRGQWKSCELTPYTTLEELRSFAQYARQRMPKDAKEHMPTAPVTIQRYFCDYRAIKAKRATIMHIDFEPVVSPMDMRERALANEGETA